MMGIQYTCDECGAVLDSFWSGLICGMTGRVVKDGVDFGQDVQLCEEHSPRPGERQPHNCEHISFHWPVGQ